MIQIDRGPTPDCLSVGIIDRIKDYIDEYYSKNNKLRHQRRMDFTKFGSTIKELDDEILLILRERFNGRCAYCEAPTAYLQRDRFRPLQGVTFRGEFDSDYYGWLAYDWENLYTACPRCNAHKRNIFPIEGVKRAPLLAPISEVYKQENALLIDPCIDDPSQHLKFDSSGKIFALTQRGEVTIKVLRLDEPVHIEKRAKVAAQVKSIWNELDNEINQNVVKRSPRENDRRITMLISSLKTLTSPKTGRYLATVRDTLEECLLLAKPELTNVLSRNLVWQEIVQSKYLQILNQSTNKFFVKSPSNQVIDFDFSDLHKKWISCIKTSNLRDIEDINIEFDLDMHTYANWLMLVGENATGKSTLLQLIALTLMSDKDRRNLKVDASAFLRKGEEVGYIKVFLGGADEPNTLLFKKGKKSFYGQKNVHPDILALGYGPIRLITPSGKKRKKGHGLKNLFDPLYSLVNPNEWLNHLHHLNDGHEKYEAVARTLSSLLPIQDTDLTLQPSTNGMHELVNLHEDPILLDSLSAGYRNIIALTCDILLELQRHFPDSSVSKGIVFIDEIDTHLHPRWKMLIVKKLRREFPYIQFIATTHDPLCLHGLKVGEVAVMRRIDNETVTLQIKDLPSPEGYRSDQLLTSEFFGLNSTVDEETEKLFSDYYHLLALRELNEEQKQELDKFKKKIAKLNFMGNTRRERMMYEAIDLYLAKVDNLRIENFRDELKADTKQKIADIWRNVESEGNHS